MKKLVVIAMALFAGVFGLQAQIGLNQTECQGLYGGDKKGGNGQEWEKLSFYRAPVFTNIAFVNNKAVAAVFKSEKRFSCDDLKNILAKNGLCLVVNQTPYVVQKGDNPWKLARKFGTTSTEIIKMNGLDAKKVLSVGQTLKIPLPTNCTCLADVRQNLMPRQGELCVAKNACPGEAGYAATPLCCGAPMLKGCPLDCSAKPPHHHQKPPMSCCGDNVCCHPCACAKWTGKGLNVTVNPQRNMILVISDDYMNYISNHPMAKNDFELAVEGK